MLGINYERNKELYQEFGMFKRMKVNKDKKSKQILLEHDLSTRIHDILFRVAKRHKNRLPQPQAFVNAFKGIVYNIKLKDKVDKDVRKKFKKEKKIDLELVSSSVTKAVNDTENSEDEQLFTKEDLNDYNTLYELLQRMQGVIPIILIMHEKFEQEIPQYIQQIRDKVTVEEINVHQNVVDYNNPYFKRLFKRWVKPDSVGKINKQSFVDDEFIIVNDSMYENDTVIKLNGIQKYQGRFWNMQYSKLTFKNEKGLCVQLISRIKFEDALMSVNSVLGDNYETYLLSSRPAAYDVFGLSIDSKLIRVNGISYPRTRNIVNSFMNKVMNKINDASNVFVNVVVIANKATGKTKVMNKVVELMTQKGYDVGSVSSDNYGRWRYATHGLKTDITDSGINTPCHYSDFSKYNEEMDSVYEVYAKVILDLKGITNFKQYDKLYPKAKDRLKAEIKDYLMLHIGAQAKYGENYYYDCMLNSIGRPRILFIESHFAALNAVIARTDLTCNLKTINDSYLAIIDRGRGGPEQLLLYDTYNDLNNAVFTTIYPYELCERFSN